MEVFIGIIIFVLIIVVCVFYIVKNNKKKEKLPENFFGNEIQIVGNESYFPIVEIIENNEVIPLNKNKITNIKVKDALAKIDNTVPKGTVATKNIKNAKEVLDNGKVFFSAKASDVKKMLEAGEKGKYYGTQIDSKTKKFVDQTKFTKETALSKDLAKQQLTSAGMNVASMVVGQYYMNEINDKLEEISESINNISNFQDSEYQGKLLHIVSKMKEILDNQGDILNNEESRKNAYHDIKELESKCSELLGQANSMIKKQTVENEIDYKKYEKIVKNIKEWYIRQQLTQDLLMKIGDLRYTLANGSETFKLSHTQYNNYLINTNNTNAKLENWHNKYINKFGIDIDKQRKKGSLFKVREYTIGMIKDDWKYNKLQGDIVKEISYQMQKKDFMPVSENKKDEVIKIQKYNGEYYNFIDNEK